MECLILVEMFHIDLDGRKRDFTRAEGGVTGGVTSIEPERGLLVGQDGGIKWGRKKTSYCNKVYIFFVCYEHQSIGVYAVVITLLSYRRPTRFFPREIRNKRKKL